MTKFIASALIVLASIFAFGSIANAGSLPIPAKCGPGKYCRTTNGDLSKVGLMTVLDAGYNAVNVKVADGSMSNTDRPNSGPVMAGSCVLTAAKDVGKASSAGCRAGVTSYTVVKSGTTVGGITVNCDSILFTTTKGNFVYTKGTFGWSMKKIDCGCK